MEFIDLKAQYKLHQNQILNNINKVLDHGQYIMGPEVKELEQKLASFVGVKHCINVANGTDALMLVLMALDLKPGDEVITTAFSFFAAVEVIALLGLKPVFVDINPNTYNLDYLLLEKVITKKTKAIIPVSLYGQCADYTKINDIANRYNIPVIEDGAQSFGAMHYGKFSCGLTTVATTSFFPSKPLGCYGDGGACFTNDDVIAEKLRMLRIHGQKKRYYHTEIGVNSRLDTLQAAILLTKLEIFKEEIEKREKIGNYYSNKLKNISKTPYIEPFNTSVYAQYTVEVDNRDSCIAYLKEKGVPTAVHYPIALHKQPAIMHFIKDQFFISEEKASRVLSLPMHPYLSFDDVDFVCQTLEEAINKSN